MWLRWSRVRIPSFSLKCFGSSVGQSISLRTRGSQVRILPEVPDIAVYQQLVAGQAHNLKVGDSSPPPVTNMRMPEWSKGGGLQNHCSSVQIRFLTLLKRFLHVPMELCRNLFLYINLSRELSLFLTLTSISSSFSMSPFSLYSSIVLTALAIKL